MPRVLCIESDASVRAVVHRLLEPEGLTVEEAPTALAGLQRALTFPPDLILADTHLPDLDGPELAARAKQEQALARVPFVAMGVAADERDVAIAAGADGFVQQPLDPRAFPSDIRSYLDGRRETLPADGERLGLRTLSAALAQHLETAISSATRARERLAESDRLRSAFMHDVAHELSTPLTPIAGYLKILQSDKLGALSPQHRKVIDAMSSAVRKLSRIIDNLADFASLQAGQALIHASELDPDQLVAEVVEEQRAAIREARLTVDVRPSGAGPVEADARKLRQAVANLVGNAVKFSPHGGSILVEVLRDGRRLRIAVYDQGPGIAPADASHVFDPFFHAARPHGEETRQPGSGLGLPVAKSIVEAHGGTLTVESPPHSQPASGGHHYTGSKFVVEIPVAREVEKARAAQG